MDQTMLFFGRQRELAELRENVFQVPAAMGSSRCYSIMGPNNVGKTTLVSQLANQLRDEPLENVYCFQTYIEVPRSERTDSYWHFWARVLRGFAKTIPEQNLRRAPNPNPDIVEQLLKIYAFFDDSGNMDRIGTDSFHLEATEHLNMVFYHYTDLGIRIVLIIDEFDLARSIFHDGCMFQRLFSLTPKAGGELLNLSILLLSRRHTSTIAHHMDVGSNFPDAFPELALRGFSNGELDEYFSSYKALSCGELSPQAKADVLFYCGRSPGLLMEMRKQISMLPENDPIDIGKIYMDRGGFIANTYRRLIELLKTEFADHLHEEPCFGKYVQTFIGPAYENNLQTYVQKMYEYGYITRVFSGEKNIYQLSETDDKWSHEFEPLSPHFVEYVRDNVLLEMRETIIGYARATELELRKIITRVMKAKYPEDWKRRLEYAIQGKQFYVESLRRAAYSNEVDESRDDVNALRVMSFGDYCGMIRGNWAEMSPYFASYIGNPPELDQDLEALTLNRNCYGHENSDILSVETVRRMKGICQRLQLDIRRGIENGGRLPENAASTAPGREAAEGGAIPPMTETPFFDGVAQPRGNLRGMIRFDGRAWPASISTTAFFNCGRNARAYEHAEFAVRVLQFDPNAGLYNVEFPDMPEIANIPLDPMAGREGPFTVAEIKKKGSLRGTIHIDGQDHEASISKKALDDAGLYAPSLLGRQIRATILRYDDNAGLYNAVPCKDGAQ